MLLIKVVLGNYTSELLYKIFKDSFYRFEIAMQNFCVDYLELVFKKSSKTI